MKIFFTDLNSPSTSLNIDLGNFQKFLSAPEKARLGKITNIKAKRNFICGRVLIKTTLAKMLSCEAGDVVLKATANGRLEIYSPKSDLHFNISHSNNFIALAVSNKAVGIDIEQNKDRNFLDIAEYFFSNNEFESVKKLDSNEERKRLFYYYWTIKESFVKCAGANLFDKSSNLECLIDLKSKTIQHDFEEEYQILTTNLDGEYTMSIAAKEFSNEQEFIEAKQITNLESGEFCLKKFPKKLILALDSARKDV
ncbi:MAG: 4'-phosphopantetheinyl transferase [Rickettsiales bacterium]|jgi:4'-phosphopantetheinyl transferase